MTILLAIRPRIACALLLVGLLAAVLALLAAPPAQAEDVYSDIRCALGPGQCRLIDFAGEQADWSAQARADTVKDVEFVGARNELVVSDANDQDTAIPLPYETTAAAEAARAAQDAANDRRFDGLEDTDQHLHVVDTLVGPLAITLTSNNRWHEPTGVKDLPTAAQARQIFVRVTGTGVDVSAIVPTANLYASGAGTNNGARGVGGIEFTDPQGRRYFLGHTAGAGGKPLVAVNDQANEALTWTIQDWRIRYPLSCADGQVAKWAADDGHFACAADESGSGGVSTVNLSYSADATGADVESSAGTNARLLPATATNAGLIVPSQFSQLARLPTVACSDGQIPKWSSNAFICAADSTGAGAGTQVTAATAGDGLAFSSGVLSVNAGQGIDISGDAVQVELDGTSLVRGANGIAINTGGVRTAHIGDGQVTVAKLQAAVAARLVPTFAAGDIDEYVAVGGTQSNPALVIQPLPTILSAAQVAGIAAREEATRFIDIAGGPWESQSESQIEARTFTLNDGTVWEFDDVAPGRSGGFAIDFGRPGQTAFTQAQLAEFLRYYVRVGDRALALADGGCDAVLSNRDLDCQWDGETGLNFPLDFAVGEPLGDENYVPETSVAGQICLSEADAHCEWRTASASTTRAGLVELATEDEAEAGTDTARAVTPEGVHAAIAHTRTTQPTVTDVNLLPVALGVTDSAQSARSVFREANPVVDLSSDLYAAGVIEYSLTLDIRSTGRSATGIAFVSGGNPTSADLRRRVTGLVFRSPLAGAAAYAASGTMNGVRIAEALVYNGAITIGRVRVFMVRGGTGGQRVGVYVDYEGSGENQRWTFDLSVDALFEHQDVPSTASGGGPALAETACPADVTVDTPATDGWSPWTTVVETSAATKAGVIAVSGAALATLSPTPSPPAASEVALSGGGDRTESQMRIVRTRSGSDTVLGVPSIPRYGPRNMASAAASLPNYIAATRTYGEAMGWNDTAVVGDVLKLQVRHITQGTNVSPPAQRRMTYAAGDCKLSVLSW